MCIRDSSKTTAAHALSYAITKRYGVDHGNAAALTLGHFIEDHSSGDTSRLQSTVPIKSHEFALGRIHAALKSQDASSARRAFVELLDDLGLHSRISSAGQVDDDILSSMAASVNAQRLGNNPFSYSSEQLLDVLRRAV